MKDWAGIFKNITMLTQFGLFFYNAPAALSCALLVADFPFRPGRLDLHTGIFSGFGRFRHGGL